METNVDQRPNRVLGSPLDIGKSQHLARDKTRGLLPSGRRSWGKRRSKPQNRTAVLWQDEHLFSAVEKKLTSPQRNNGIFRAEASQYLQSCPVRTALWLSERHDEIRRSPLTVPQDFGDYYLYGERRRPRGRRERRVSWSVH